MSAAGSELSAHVFILYLCTYSVMRGFVDIAGPGRPVGHFW